MLSEEREFYSKKRQRHINRCINLFWILIQINIFINFHVCHLDPNPTKGITRENGNKVFDESKKSLSIFLDMIIVLDLYKIVL